MQTRLSSSGAVAAVFWWLLVLQPPRVRQSSESSLVEKEPSMAQSRAHGVISNGAGETSDIRDTAGTGRGRACVELSGIVHFASCQECCVNRVRATCVVAKQEGATARFPSQAWVTIQRNATRRKLLEFLPPVCPGPQCIPPAAVRELGSGPAPTGKARAGVGSDPGIRTCQTAVLSFVVGGPGRLRSRLGFC